MLFSLLLFVVEISMIEEAYFDGLIIAVFDSDDGVVVEVVVEDGGHYEPQPRPCGAYGFADDKCCGEDHLVYVWGLIRY